MKSIPKFLNQVLLFNAGMLLTSATKAEDTKENNVYELVEPTQIHEVLSIYRLLAADERVETFGTHHTSSGYGTPGLSDVDCISTVKR